MINYTLATINCQNCKHCYYKKPGETACRVKKFNIPESKLKSEHKRECPRYEFWIPEGKEKKR